MLGEKGFHYQPSCALNKLSNPSLMQKQTKINPIYFSNLIAVFISGPSRTKGIITHCMNTWWPYFSQNIRINTT